MPCLVATRSAHKLAEIGKILADVPGLQLTDLEGAAVPESDEERGLERFATFEENAVAKARYFAAKSGIPSLADDSGLEVDALDGRPGVRSRRFAHADGLPPDVQDRLNNERLLELLGGTSPSQRTARYVCVAALAFPDGTAYTFRGVANGLILGCPRGTGGFGYDPLFYDRGIGRTFAELTPEEKNERSHRGEAFRAVARFLRECAAEKETQAR